MLMTMFDKSFIHGISLDEAVIFDAHFFTNITPLFFVEVLGDLEKGDMTDARARNSLIKSLAAKTPSYHSYANVPHTVLAEGELCTAVTKQATGASAMC